MVNYRDLRVRSKITAVFILNKEFRPKKDFSSPLLIQSVASDVVIWRARRTIYGFKLDSTINVNLRGSCISPFMSLLPHMPGYAGSPPGAAVSMTD